MRTSNRNKQTYWYALYSGKTPIYDEYKNENGYTVEYGKPVKASGNISPAKGAAATMQFGIDESYDRVIVTQERDIPINEQTVLWIDMEPRLDAQGNLAKDTDGKVITPWNYVVRRVARGLPVFGATQIAIAKVDVA